MPDLLFLAHRIPYPPEKGDKIRAWNILSHLCEGHRVYLGCFVDEPRDWQHVPHLRRLCTETYFATIRRPQAAARCLSGIVTDQSLTLSYYRDKGLAAWVGELLAHHQIDCCYIFSSAMAQFVMAPAHGSIRRVMDFVDVDSEKWREYGARKPWPSNRLYQRESRKLFGHERNVARTFDASVFVSTAEATLFGQLVPESLDKIHAVANGVDAAYFSPDRRYECPFVREGPVVVFTGAMDYWPNVEAATWFATDVLPLIRRTVPQTQFYIIGAAPTGAVQRLDKLPGVRVTGRVPDVRPYLAHAAVVVAPLRLARGVQNKVLEAMAMARPLVATPQALEGLEIQLGTEVLAADDTAGLAQKVVSVLSSSCAGDLGDRARAGVLARYNWARSLERITELVDGA